VLVLLLLLATATAFVVTQHLKLEPSPISQTHVDKTFSPVCNCADVPDGVYHAVVHMQRAQRTIDLPNPIRVDTVKPTIALTSMTPDGAKTLFRYRTSEPAHALLFVNGERRIRTYYTVKRGKFAYAGRLTPKSRLVLRARDVAGNLSRPVKISSL
jgi:hypothetical protein